MRLLTGAALAAALLLTGCGTQADPFAASPAAQAKADNEANEAKALELALLACEVAGTPLPENDKVKWGEASANTIDAAGLASEAAYYDSRWRTLADAFPRVVELYDILDAEAKLNPGQELDSWVNPERARLSIYLTVTRSECWAAEQIDIDNTIKLENATE